MLLLLVTSKAALAPSGVGVLPGDRGSSPASGATLERAPQGCAVVLFSAHPTVSPEPRKGRALLPEVSCRAGTASPLFECPTGQLLGPHPIRGGHREPVARGGQHVAGEPWPLLVAVNRQGWVRGEGLAPVDIVSSGEHEERAESHLLLLQPCVRDVEGRRDLIP